MFNDKVVLITGGTGTFGKSFTKHLLANYKTRKVIILSRDEFKQYEMQRQFGEIPELRYFIGDVRDKDRLYRAFYGVDYAVHAAAFKQVVAAEYNPFEAIKTNILGGQNVIEACIDNNVKKVVTLSTDKAANPVNLYGATKLASDKLFVAGNSYAGGRKTRFSVVRYGNVLGSRGSVLPLFLEQRLKGVVTITEPSMTRFWITLPKAISLVEKAFALMQGGETFVPKIPSMRMDDFAKALAPDAEIKVLGIRPGEKMHEIMIPVDDARHTREYNDHYRIIPEFLPWVMPHNGENRGNALPDSFSYSSDNNIQQLSAEELCKTARLVAEECGIPY
ncbi:MAG: UDP-N-acetylglucosamine 4,6-dehydratase (inverting) [Deferribacteraceae bacterium]|jgi:UDP-N-acetylglucosamine 4,6-dehydratase|nr:UDP-N-acetylglucosamine 4,6-dehydratase (inverting) [Deferribacteraceae bacterium]